ncbi:hypothetical protein M1D93_20165 (plasmid) [Arthrobacter sp. Z1-9]
MTPSPGPASEAVNQIDWSLLFTIAGVIVAIVAIFFGVWAARRWGTRRNLLQIDYRIRPLKPFSLMTDKGVEVVPPNPPIQFDVELKLTNLGPQDILPEHFGGQELRFSVSPARLISDRTMSNLKSGVLVLDTTDAKLYPLRIAVGQSLFYMIRTADARPDLWVDTPLANVKVRRSRHRDQDASPMGTFTFPGANRWLGSRVSEF